MKEIRAELRLFDEYIFIGLGDYLDNAAELENLRDDLLSRHHKWRNLDGLAMSQNDFKCKDDRIHCVFYFIAAHRFRAIDKAFILKLAKLVNIVPVIAKADCMTLDERKRFLCEVHYELEKLSTELQYLPIYDFQEEDDADKGCLEVLTNDEESRDKCARQRFLPPDEITAILNDETLPSVFKSIGEHLNMQSSEPTCPFLNGELRTAERDGTAERSLSPAPVLSSAYELPRVKGIFGVVCDINLSGYRVYPWGSLCIDDEQHSDFRRLQKLVFESGECMNMETTLLYCI